MARSFVLFVALIALCGLLPPAAAARSGAAEPSRGGAEVHVADDDATKKDSPAVGKSAGTIDGQVATIDYRSSTMTVSVGSRKVDVTILPSTNVQGPNNAFRTIADIQKGSRVRVLLSERAGTFTAQIITLR